LTVTDLGRFEKLKGKCLVFAKTILYWPTAFFPDFFFNILQPMKTAGETLVKGAGETSLDHLALSQNISAKFSIAQRVSTVQGPPGAFPVGSLYMWALHAHIPEAFYKVKILKWHGKYLKCSECSHSYMPFKGTASPV
jgi:hypothetical protein